MGTNILEVMNEIKTAIEGIPEPTVTVNVPAPVVYVDVDGSGSCNPCGTELPDDPTNGNGNPSTDPPPGDYPDWPTVNAYKCKVANWLYDAHWLTYHTFANMNASGLLAMGVGALGILLASVLAAGPAGVALDVFVVAGAVIAIAVLWLTESLPDFGNMQAELEANHEGLVCALYSALTGQDAHDDFMAIINASALTAVEKQTVSALLVMRDINKLFPQSTADEVPGLSSYSAGNGIYSGIDCAVCGQVSGFQPLIVDPPPDWTWNDPDWMLHSHIGQYKEPGSYDYIINDGIQKNGVSLPSQGDWPVQDGCYAINAGGTDGYGARLTQTFTPNGNCHLAMGWFKRTTSAPVVFGIEIWDAGETTLLYSIYEGDGDIGLHIYTERTYLGYTMLSGVTYTVRIRFSACAVGDLKIVPA